MVCLGLWTTSGIAQVTSLLNPTYGYIFSNSLGTYTALSGGTVFQSGLALNTNTVSGAIPLPFPFTFNGIKENNIFISNNGFITFGIAAAPSNIYPIALVEPTGYDGAIAGAATDLATSFATGAASEIRYGSNASGDFVVQYKDLAVNSEVLVRITFQIILKANGKTVQIVYGPNNVGGAGLGYSAQVGLRGANDEDYNHRQIASGGNWNTTAGATAPFSTGSMFLTSTNILPVSGRTFQWVPNAYTPTYLL